MKLLPFPKNRNGCRSICRVWSRFKSLRDLCFPERFSRRSSKTKRVQLPFKARAPRSDRGARLRLEQPWQNKSMLIRPAAEGDAKAIWAIMEPIIRAGE